MATETEIVVFHPVENPIRGLRPQYIGAALSNGQYKQILNSRWADTGVPTKRLGYGAQLGTINGGTGSPRGFKTFVLSFDGTTQVTVHMGAVRDTTTKVFVSTDGCATWAEVSQAGAAGNKYSPAGAATRFTNDGLVFFEVTRHPQQPSKDVIVVQNGSELPRVYDGTNYAIHQSISPDEKAASTNPIATFAGYAGLGDPANTSFPAAGVVNQAGRFIGADTAASPNNTVTFTATVAGLLVGDTARVLMTNGFGGLVTKPKQFFLVMDVNPAYNWFRNNKVTIDDDAGGHTVTLWDPTDTTGLYAEPFPIPMSVTGAKNNQGTLNMWVFTMNADDSLDMTTFKAMSHSWVGTVPAAGTYVATIYAFGLSGGIFPGDTEFAVARRNSGTKAYSPAYQYEYTIGARIKDIGGPQNNSTRIPVSPLAFYQIRVQASYANATDVARGVDQECWFYRRVQDSKFIQSSGVGTLATFGGGPPSVWTGAGTAGTLFSTKLDFTGFFPQGTIQWLVPDEQHITIPIGKGMCYKSGRLFVMAKGDSTGGPGLYFSADGNGFAFRVNADPNQGEESPSANGFPGEICQSILASQTSTFQVSQYFCWTDQQCYTFRGTLTSELSYVQHVGPHGTLSPYSPQEYMGAVFWLDQELQVRKMNAGEPPRSISKNWIDNIVSVIPGDYVAYVCGVVYSHNYYMAMTPFGQTTNKYVWVWNILQQTWESLDTPANSAQFFSKWNVGSGSSSGVSQNLMLASDLKVFRYETPSVYSDNSVAINFSLTPWSLSMTGSKYNEFEIRRASYVGLASGSTVVTNRTYVPGGGSLPGSFVLPSGGDTCWVTEDTFGEPTGSAWGRSGSLSISISSTVAERMEQLTAEGVLHTSGGGPVSG